MPKLAKNEPFPTLTRKSQYEYWLTEKHHGGPSSKGQANWLPELTKDEEFTIFDEADFQDYRDDAEHYYGIMKTPDTKCLTIGTQGEQIAIFRLDPWHGYPIYPLAGDGDRNCPDNMVFDRMVETKLITKGQARRLKGGKTI